MPGLIEDLDQLQNEALTAIEQADSLDDLEQVRVALTGRKGRLTQVMKQVSQVPKEERPAAGKAANRLKETVNAALEQARERLESRARASAIETETIDITLPGRVRNVGRFHPLRATLNEIEEIFVSMGYAIAEGPDIENDFNNFQALNFPDEHPARDMQDTFYLREGWVLRTHTSPVQIRVMLEQKPPLAIIAPGRVFRADADVTHSPMFHQVEGLLVDRRVTLGDLKGVLAEFAHRIFDAKRPVRFRPSFFPFTEPSAELDIGCVICGGRRTGCRVCGETGWLEILGAGMVHPAVFENVGIDPEEWTGFAFGMGIERIAMLKYGIDDIRLFFENDMRFLRQF